MVIQLNGFSTGAYCLLKAGQQVVFSGGEDNLEDALEQRNG